MRKIKPYHLESLIKKELRLSLKKPYLYEAALSHPSFRNENPSHHKLQDFDRLEFFGDVVLNFVVCKKLYRSFPDADEGLLSRLRSILVSRKILSRIAKEQGFLKLVRLGRGLEKQDQNSKKKILADAFEAFIAALYFDKGFSHAEKFILKLFKSYFDAKRLFRLDPNPKSMLQEISQKKWQKIPTYQFEITPDGFTSIVSIDHLKKASASGKTKQEAEERAARLLIRKLKNQLARLSKKESSGKKVRKLA